MDGFDLELSFSDRLCGLTYLQGLGALLKSPEVQMQAR